MVKLRKSSPKEMGPYRASKWIHIQAMLDPIELKDLFTCFDEIYIFIIGKMFCQMPTLEKSEIIEALRSTKEKMLQGILDLKHLSKITPFAISKNTEDFYEFTPKENLTSVQIQRPVIQVQLHRFRYSSVDQSFRSMVLSSDSVFWGFQFSFPQIFQEAKSQEIHKVDRAAPNSFLWNVLRKWIRTHTTPTRLMVDDRVINHPMRLGKKCLPWISLHPQITPLDFGISNS